MRSDFAFHKLFHQESVEELEMVRNRGQAHNRRPSASVVPESRV